ncbi:MAG TPA: efflux RND transporter periplasmic adaptor subunit [Acidobacteriota bacterium]|nr:efflux RND transporter periplasmic adaptor subunit [Acidobacteriota bacterium]
MTTRVKVYSFLFMLALLVGGGYLVREYYTTRADASPSIGQNPEAEEAQGAPVELAEAVQGHIADYIEATANLRALREVDISARQAGVITAVLAEEGDKVARGQALCVLDDRELQIRLELTRERLYQAKIQLEQAQIQLEKAITQKANTKQELARLEKAFNDKLISDRELAQARYQLDEIEHDERVSASETRELRHRVDELEAEIRQVELEIARSTVVAPFAGHITLRRVEIGQTVREQDPLFKLGAFSPLYADVYLSEREAHQVKNDHPAIVQLGVDETIEAEGRVLRSSPVVDQATGTVKITVELTPNDSLLKPGAFVRVRIQTDSHPDAVLVPKRALIEDDGGFFVFVCEGDSVRRANVEKGFESAAQVEITRGLQAGEKVVIAGQGALTEGAKVRVIKG